jgi:UDP-4-amino-4-deoxy-L-arabinose-oxoglutarate aminotransferase
MDIGPGDEVIVPAMTFIATANVVELVGAKPVFVDCDPDTLLITSELIKAAITKNTKAVIPVHMYGQMCDVKSIKDALPTGQKISIIEDCAHTFEAKLNGDRPGKYSDAAIFSFYATKNVTCGEGGAITTNDSKLYERIQQSILHGMSAGAADRFKTGQYKHWGMDHLGTKANLPDLLACFLPDQIRTIDERLSRREEISSFYEKSLSGTKISFPKIRDGATHARHLFPIYVGGEVRDQSLSLLGEAGIGVTVNYRDVPSMSYYRKKYYHKLGDFKISENWGAGTLTIPLYPDMSEAEQGHVIDFLIEKIDPLIKQVD